MADYPHDRDFLERLDAVEARLTELAVSMEGLTTPDAATGEQWEDGQVWGHLNESVPFWIGQISNVIDTYDGEPVPFGRPAGSTSRAEAIAAGKGGVPEDQWVRLRATLGDLRSWLQGMPDMGLVAMGAHYTRGDMAAWEAIDAYIISHLEQHADQLEELASGQGEASSDS
jgi:hypothetical protein